MQRLDRQRMARLSEFLQELYALGGLEAFRRRLVSSLATVIPAEVLLYSELDPATHSGRLVANDGVSFGPDIIGGLSRHLDDIPWRSHYRRGEGSAVKVSDFLSTTQFHRKAVYNEFYRKAGFSFHLVKGLPGPLGTITTIGLGRARGDFTETDRLVLNLLRPHLNQAYRNAEAVTRLEDEVARVKGAVEALDRGLAVLDGEGRSVWMTRRAQQLLARYVGPPGRHDGALPESLRRWVASRTAPLADDGAMPEPHRTLTVTRGSGSLTVRLLRGAGRSVLLLDEQGAEVPAAPLQALGLSPREAEVLAWIAAGKTNEAIASILGASPRTVDKHVERILAKLGVENRTGAAARALGFLASGLA